ncbi:metallophosphoesterase [Salinicola rhizosphaerae]|uniref:metallophosphoesterase n=1 Tax=Salinicola rhizosphaerae TaxID=1443141 RepID=UPI001679862D|nr:metallophosphoesterase [Salinicola rhizosphaerae]
MRHHRSFLRIRLLLLILHLYVGWRLIPDLAVGTIGSALLGAYLVASALLIPLVVRVTWLNGRWLAWPVAIMTGLFSFLLGFTLVRDVVLGVWAVAGSPSTAILTSSAWLVLVATLMLAGYALWQGRRLPPVVEVDVALETLPAGLDGFTIVQLSDLHIGPTIKGGHLRRIIERTNALSPDLVAITGDLTDGRVDELMPELESLSRIEARHGTFCVTGNHEYYSEAEAWVAAFRRLGLRVLVNEFALLEHDTDQLAVAGITDLTAGYYVDRHRSDPTQAAEGMPQGIPRILLAHQPNSAPAAALSGFDLQLSGHTHGGQIWPWSLLARRANRFLAGLGREGRMWVYTSRGTGYWGPPMRLGAPSEITRIRLRQAEGASIAQT